MPNLRTPKPPLEAVSRVGPSPELAEQKSELEQFLYNQVYRHPQARVGTQESPDQGANHVCGLPTEPGPVPGQVPAQSEKDRRTEDGGGVHSRYDRPILRGEVRGTLCPNGVAISLLESLKCG